MAQLVARKPGARLLGPGPLDHDGPALLEASGLAPPASEQDLRISDAGIHHRRFGRTAIPLELARRTGLDTEVDRRSLALLAALLLHVTFFGLARVATSWQPRIPAAPPPLVVEMEPLNPRADSLNRKLLLSKPNRSARDEPPPKDARYFSDRNRRVEQEMRARSGGIADLSQLQSRALQQALRDAGPGVAARPNLARGVPGEAQRLDDDRLAEGAENLLNTVQSIHYSFYSRMYGSLAPVWQNLVRNSRFTRALSPGDYTVVADLVLDEQGNLIGVEFRERSPVERLNEVVIASAQKIGKFPNPPRELISDDRKVRTLWSFTVNVDEHSLLRLAPPRRLQ